jgi:predicted glycosyltransferase
MNPRSPPRRFALFTHDTYGLGHVRRCIHIMSALAQRSPDCAMLLITGCPALQVFGDLPRNADVLKLPTVVRSGQGGSKPPHLPIDLSELLGMRTQLVSTALRSFRPDVFLVDNFPRGVLGELAEPLELAATQGTRLALGLRDIVADPQDVRHNWRTGHIYELLEERYDAILVYGHREVLDAAQAYGLNPAIAAKLRYCGYVASPDRPAPVDAEILAAHGIERPFILVTVGGGGDGLPCIESCIAALDHLDGLSALILTGPLMGKDDRQRVSELARHNPRFVVEEFVPDVRRFMLAADVTVCMAGYNTVAEVMTTGCRSVVLPRTWRFGEHLNRHAAPPEGEQRLRAAAVSQAGRAETLEPGAATPVALAAAISKARRAAAPAALPAEGAARCVDVLLELAEKRTGIAA